MMRTIQQVNLNFVENMSVDIVKPLLCMNAMYVNENVSFISFAFRNEFCLFWHRYDTVTVDDKNYVQ